MYRFLALASSGALALAANAASALTIVDSSFESPDALGAYIYDPTVSGATFTGDAGVTTVGAFSFATAAPDGVQVGFLQTGGDASSITLDISGLEFLSTYDVEFFISERSGFPTEAVTVSTQNEGYIGTVEAGTTSFVQVDAGSFIAEDISDTITFSFAGADGDVDVGIDDVTLNGLGGGGPSAAPEPVSWALMLIGVGALGGVLRTRRRIAAATA